jgi:hypothetical protein
MAPSDLSPNRDKTSLLVPLSIWAVFLTGLLLQLFSPHLQVAHDSFVIPADVMSRGSPVDPHALVRQERMIQLSSALLVLAGAIGLALFYRRTLFRYLFGKGE